MADVFEQDFRSAQPKRKVVVDDPIIMAMVKRGGAGMLARLAGAYRAGVLSFPGGGIPKVLQNYLNTGRYGGWGPTAAANDPRVAVAINSMNQPNKLDEFVTAILGKNLPGYMTQALQAQNFSGKLYLDDNILRRYLDTYGNAGLSRLNELAKGGFINNHSTAFTTYQKTGGLPSLLGFTPAALSDKRVQIFNQPASNLYNYGLTLSKGGYPGYAGWQRQEVGGTPPGAAPPPARPRTPPESNAFLSLKKYLNDLGFPNIDAFARKFIKSGKPMELLEMELRQTPQFAQRFPGIKALEKIKDQNPQANVLIPTPQEYIEYERQAASLLASAGLWNLATKANVARWITNQRSMVELGEIIKEGYEAVSKAPREVRESFREYYGPNGDAALASYFLNTKATASQIKEDVAAAQVGGAARLNQIGIGKTLSDRISDLGISFNEALQGFGTVRTRDALLRGTLTQGAFNQNTAIEAQFGMNATAANTLERRRQERLAAFGGGGRAGSSDRGIALGSAI